MPLQGVGHHRPLQLPISHNIYQSFFFFEASIHHFGIHSHKLVRQMIRYLQSFLHSSCRMSVKFSKPSFLNIYPIYLYNLFLILCVSVLFVAIFYKNSLSCTRNSQYLSVEPDFCRFEFPLPLWSNCPAFSVIQEYWYHIAAHFLFPMKFPGSSLLFGLTVRIIFFRNTICILIPVLHIPSSVKRSHRCLNLSRKYRNVSHI